MNTQKQLLETISRCTEQIRILCEENLNLKERNRLLQEKFDYIEYRHNILLASRLHDMANYSSAMVNLEDEDEDVVCGPPVRDVANYSREGVKIQHQDEDEEDEDEEDEDEDEEDEDEDLVCGPPVRDVANYSREGVKLTAVSLVDDMELEELDEHLEEAEAENEAEDEAEDEAEAEAEEDEEYEAMELDEEVVYEPPVRDVANYSRTGLNREVNEVDEEMFILENMMRSLSIY